MEVPQDQINALLGNGLSDVISRFQYWVALIMGFCDVGRSKAGIFPGFLVCPRPVLTFKLRSCMRTSNLQNEAAKTGLDYLEKLMKGGELTVMRLTRMKK